MQTTVSISLAYHADENRIPLEDVAVYVERKDSGDLSYRVIGIDLGNGEVVRMCEAFTVLCELKIEHSAELKAQIATEWNERQRQAAE